MRATSHPARRVGRLALLAALVCALPACSSAPSPSSMPTQPGAAGSPIRVIVLTATRGFRHDSIPIARDVLTALSASGEFSVTTTEDVGSIDAATLGAFDVLIFALTSGELPFDSGQRAAILSFVSGGKGFLGVHSASDTLYEWPEYGALVGAYFLEHPWTATATVVVEDPTHPSTAGLGDRFTLMEEFYTFRENPRPKVQVLLRLDAASVGAAGDYPLAWCQSYGAGRACYNALGHFQETWRDPRFQRQMAGAIRWLARR